VRSAMLQSELTWQFMISLMRVMESVRKRAIICDVTTPTNMIAKELIYSTCAQNFMVDCPNMGFFNHIVWQWTLLRKTSVVPHCLTYIHIHLHYGKGHYVLQACVARKCFLLFNISSPQNMQSYNYFLGV